jgi:hypothetical protein
MAAAHPACVRRRPCVPVVVAHELGNVLATYPVDSISTQGGSDGALSGYAKDSRRHSVCVTFETKRLADAPKPARRPE